MIFAFGEKQRREICSLFSDASLKVSFFNFHRVLYKCILGSNKKMKKKNMLIVY